eukprot:366282-Chlamydomonas_euryale.AAC.4
MEILARAVGRRKEAVAQVQILRGTVKGGGLIGQAEAIKLGVARALCEIEASSLSSSDLEGQVKKQLRTKGYLTQDARVKERRKYGLKKARKATQYNKR